MHVSVLKDEVIASLDIKKNGIYIDCTLGHGGHSLEILKILDGTGHLYSIDQDEDAIAIAKEKLSSYNNLTIIKGNFSDIKNIIRENNISNVSGILFDIGVNSNQFDIAERGFSYRFNSFLDMRMDQGRELTASAILNTYSLEDLIKIFREYGDIKESRSLSNAILDFRKSKNIEYSFDLNEIIDSSTRRLKGKNNYAQVYQALRIEVNDEIGSIRKGLVDSLEEITIDGKVLVITFHSLEDRVVKEVFLEHKSIFTETEKEIKHKYRTFKNVYPKKEEVTNNPRSRSSKLRVIKRIY